MMNKRRGRGRPPGESGAREAILEVARRRFLADGYERVTLRSLADEAGVDAALISYHFGSKKGLFGAAMALSLNPPDVLAGVLAGPLNTLPERFLSTVVAAWDDHASANPLLALGRAAMTEPDVGRLFREMMEREMIGAIAQRIGGTDASLRASLAGSQVAGLILLRYVFALEPLASMPADELVRRFSPALRVALAGARPRRRPA